MLAWAKTPEHLCGSGISAQINSYRLLATWFLFRFFVKSFIAR
jgi:hypothetical protein